MDESALGSQLGRERSEAIRYLLALPLLQEAEEPDGFRAVVRHREWLSDWFENTLGWPLVLNVHGGWARLLKRNDVPDASRPARRSRGARQSFDRRRYELLCTICAELTRRPVTTIGLLAKAVVLTTATDEGLRRFDSAQRSERLAFVDALQLLGKWGAITFSGGDAELFVDRDDGNALLSVDSSLLNRLLASAIPSSTIEGTNTAEAIWRLVVEPRYGDAPSGGPEVDAESRNRWLRHSLARRLLDDPVLYYDDLTDQQRSYITSLSGRAWLLARAADAGFEVEERAEGKLAVDSDHIATDDVFPSPQDNVKQVALLLVDVLAPSENGVRRLEERTLAELTTVLCAMMAEHPGWAKQYQDGDGPARLVRSATEVLASFRLVRLNGDRVCPRPALARYAASAAVVSDADEQARS